MFLYSQNPDHDSWLSKGLWRLCLLAACVSLLTACAATSGGSSGSQHTLESLSREAETEMAKGQREKAIALLNQAAKENPTSMVPWLKLANIWFDSGNYPSSILAANEVLQRDAGNQEAQAMLVVSGLRVAAGAVAGLRSASSVSAGTRVEAENLTNSLRAAVGETVLIPSQADTSPAVSTARNKNTSSVKTNPGTVVSPAKPAVKAHSKSSPTAGGADPFKSLK